MTMDLRTLNKLLAGLILTLVYIERIQLKIENQLYMANKLVNKESSLLKVGE
jgi:hypothetical protein